MITCLYAAILFISGVITGCIIKNTPSKKYRWVVHYRDANIRYEGRWIIKAKTRKDALNKAIQREGGYIRVTGIDYFDDIFVDNFNKGEK